MSILSDIWRYANACYKEPVYLPFMPPCGGSKFYFWQDDTDYAMASVERDRVVIAHRGTDSAERNIRGWISNLRGLDRIHDTIDPGIHDGLGEYGRKWEKDIAQICADAACAGKKIMLTGHSRGASAAGARCFFLWNKFKIQVSSVIVFGTPNWCSREIRNQINMMPVDYTNVNTSYDIVSKIPPQEIMKRPGKEYTLITKMFLPFPPIPPLAIARGIIDHLPETYTRMLAK